MNIEEEKFLLEVITRSGRSQTIARAIINAAITGMHNKVIESREHAMEMEVVANMAMNTRLFKGNERFIADKLEKWKHMNGLRWDDQIKKLREKAK